MMLSCGIVLTISGVILGINSLKYALPKGNDNFPFLATIWVMPDKEISWIGTVVGNQRIITVAHKFYEIMNSGNASLSFSICVGAESLEDMDEESRRVQWRHNVQINFMPDFLVVPGFAHHRRGDSYQSDVAIVAFEEPLVFDQNVAPIVTVVMEEHKNYICGVKIVGWRTDTYAQLQGSINTNLLSAEICEHLGVYLLKNELCARKVDSPATLSEADIGAPIVRKGIGNQFFLIGMVVDTYQLDRDGPWVFIKVGPYVKH